MYRNFCRPDFYEGSFPLTLKTSEPPSVAPETRPRYSSVARVTAYSYNNSSHPLVKLTMRPSLEYCFVEGLVFSSFTRTMMIQVRKRTTAPPSPGTEISDTTLDNRLNLNKSKTLKSQPVQDEYSTVVRLFSVFAF